MKVVYPVILELDESDGGYVVEIPDFDATTQGDDLADALYMAADLIATLGVYHQDAGKNLPVPSNINDIKASDKDVVSLVSADLDMYRLKLENKSVRKNVTLPSWLAAEAEAAHVNFSATLQEALREKLKIA